MRYRICSCDRSSCASHPAAEGDQRGEISRAGNAAEKPATGRMLSKVTDTLEVVGVSMALCANARDNPVAHLPRR